MSVFQAPIITFLDAHCEVHYGWLPPLLASVAENRRVAVTPLVDAIDPNDFSVKNDLDDNYIGGLYLILVPFIALVNYF